MAAKTIWGNFDTNIFADSAINSGYLAVGMSSVPTNTTAGDLTATRISMGNAAHAVNSRITLLETYTNVATDVILLQPTFAPASNGKSGVVIEIAGVVAGTTNSTSSFTAVDGTLINSGTANIGNLQGLNFGVQHAGTGTAQSVRGIAIISQATGAGTGATTSIIGANMTVGLSGSGITSTQPLVQGIAMILGGGGATATLTTVTGIDFSATGMNNITSTTRRALNIGDLGAGTVTNVVAIDIAAQTAASGVTAGIRNAAPLLQTGNVGFFGAAAAGQQTSGANLTNNITAGGTTDVVDDWTSLTVYATDAAAIRNAVYQLTRKLKQINDGLRTLGVFT